MNLRNLLGPGLAVLGFAALSCCAPSCKAQEVDPDHFALTGVETYPEGNAPAARATKSTKKHHSKKHHKAATSTDASAPK